MPKSVAQLQRKPRPPGGAETAIDDSKRALLTALEKIETRNHSHAVALHMMYYNFVRIHSKLRVTPAVAAGVADRLWEVSDIVALVEAEEAKTIAKRGPYKKRIEIVP